MDKKVFNVNADCRPDKHYMVDISDRLLEIKNMVDMGQYFTINRARQYGKTTTLKALAKLLQNKYEVVSLDFQMISYENFEDEKAFVKAFSGELLDNTEGMPEEIREMMTLFSEGRLQNTTLLALFKTLSKWCACSEKKIVLLIDEVDSAANNQVFLDFLAQLRGYYIKRDTKPTFQSVILAGVYDVKNIRRKLRPNSPWNIRKGNEPSESALSFGDCLRDQMVFTPFDIAADFLVDMDFSIKDISGMLRDYEDDWHTGMDIYEMASLLYAYTSGYPFLVSRLCKLIDERISACGIYQDKKSAWTKKGFLDAVRMLLNEKNTLFESLTNKLFDYPKLRNLLYALLFMGKSIPYNPLEPSTEIAEILGFVKNIDGNVVVSNRIFESLLYNLFLAEESIESKIYDVGSQEKNQFIINGHLNMRLVLEKFVQHFNEIYGGSKDSFLEEAGRRYFLLYLKPIINGAGNYYIEAETRNRERTDIIVDYHGEQFIIEMKLWRGNAYHIRGEEQLCEYLDYYHADQGYMISFCFNKDKEIGVKETMLHDKKLIEAIV